MSDDELRREAEAALRACHSGGLPDCWVPVVEAMARHYLSTPDQAAESREVTCVWCGHKFFSDLQSQAEHLYAHARTCESHPIRKAEAEVARLTAENKRLRLQCKHSLANYLCPDHRDKQAGKP